MVGTSGRNAVRREPVTARIRIVPALFTPDFPITVYPHSFRSLNYDPLRDFTPVAPAARSMLTYNVGAGVPASVKTLADFVQWCKANPAKASYGTTAAGGTPISSG